MEDAWSVNYDIELCVVHKEPTIINAAATPANYT